MKFVKDLGMQYTSDTKKYKERYWIVECPECKNNVKACAKDIKLNKIKRCKKCATKKVSDKMKTHSLSGTKIYRIYAGMIQRCYNIKRKSYPRYGGRGISICNEWRNDFKVFYNWCIDNGYSKDLTIDRINNNGNYEPSNCRFTTKDIQCSNRSKTENKCSSTYKGVVKQGKNFIARITVQEKQVYLGSFTNEKIAANKYNDYIKENSLPHEQNII